MKRWLRRIRGAIGVGLSWSLAWGLFGGVVEAIFGLPPGATGTAVVLQEFARGFIALAGIGFLGSGVFSVALSLEGRRRSFVDMSLPRFSLWGGLAGLAVGAVLYAPYLLTIGLSTALGAGTAAGSLAIARRDKDNESIAAGDEIAGIGLAEQEARQLLD